MDTIRIPVAVHFGGGIDNSNTVCLVDASIAQVQAIAEDFSASNGDLLYVPPCPTYSSNISPGTCLELCLATNNHPPSSGIQEGEYAITIGQEYWPDAGVEWAGYLNVFVDTTIPDGSLGMSDIGGGSNPNGNGILIHPSVFGGAGISCTSGTDINSNANFNLGRTATHLLGHYFGLLDIFAGCNNGDGIDDTPDQEVENTGCPTFISPCSSNANNSCGTKDLFFNFMDGVNDNCRYNFTIDQANVIYATANNNLWSNALSDCGIDQQACVILNEVSVVSTCNNGGTPYDPSDDTFTFTLDPQGDNLGTSYSIQGDINPQGMIAYGAPQLFDNNGQGFLISSGNLELLITDEQNQNCALSFTINPPSSCELPLASYSPNSDFALCPSNPQMVFYDTSLNSPETYNWNITGPNATIVQDLDSVVVIRFDSQGLYTLDLTVTNSNGSNMVSNTFNVSYLSSNDQSCTSCAHDLILWDSGGNGWNTDQTLEVEINGSATNYTIASGASNNIPLAIVSSDVINIKCNTGVQSQEEISWRLFDSNGYVVMGDGTSFGLGPSQFDQSFSGYDLIPPVDGAHYIKSLSCEPLGPCETYSLTLSFDQYPEETAWFVTDSNNEYVLYSMGYAGLSGITIVETFCLPEGCYTFNIVDYQGDGMCCDYGNGSYSLVKTNDNTLVDSGGQFFGIESSNFCVSIPEACPEILDVSDPITTGDYVADSLLNSAGIVNSPDVVNFYAGDTICLTDNFEVQLGAEFMASIGDCTNYMAAVQGNDTFLYIEAEEDLEFSRILNKSGYGLTTKVISQERGIMKYKLNGAAAPGVYFIELKEKDGTSVFRKIVL